MKNQLVKEFFRELKISKSRFLSILLIVSLGAGFFVGVKAAAPSMKHSADIFFKEKNLMDFRIMSDYGFQESDIQAIKDIAEVKAVMPSYSADLLVNSDGKNNVVRIHALPEMQSTSESPINQVQLVEGRLPEKSGECVVESNQKIAGSYKIGDVVKFISPEADKDIKETLKVDTFKIVGLVQAPQYISFDRGITQVGDGQIYNYMLILPSDFTYERFSEVYITTNINSNISSFDSKYTNFINTLKTKLEVVGQVQLEKNREDILAKGKAQIDEEKAKLEQQKKEQWAKIQAAEDELNSAKAEIAAKEQELADAEYRLAQAADEIEASKIKIAQAEQDLAAAKIEYTEKIAQGEKDLAQGKKDYQDGLNKYNEEYEAFQKKKADAEKQIADGKAQLAQMKVLIDALEKIYAQLSKLPIESWGTSIDAIVNEIKKNVNLTDDQLVQFDKAVSELKNYINSGTESAESLLSKFRAQIDSLQKQYDEENAKIIEAERQLAEGEKQLADAKAQLDAAKKKLDEAEKTLNEEKVNGQAKLDAAKLQIDDAKRQLANAQKEYDDGLAQLADGKAQLADAKAKVAESEKQLNDAKAKLKLEFDLADEKIKKAEEELNSLPLGKWYIFTRDDNPGYTSFAQDANRIDGIASIFPVFFFLVAALVCLTTMTRMVEEQRQQIGTLKALGYDNTKIAAKYFIYALLAAVMGSIVGIILGLMFLPKVIFKAYDAMYTLPGFYVDFTKLSIVIAVIGALLCTCTVAAIVAFKELKVNPAGLMRPKAPKNGKRIFLERITFLWNRMSFSSKVTARNILRYKARFIMTVLGVAGCTALILSAYGLKDAVSVVVPKQYGEIFNYDMFINCKYEGTLEEKSNLIKLLYYDNRISESILTKQSTLDGTSDNVKKAVQVKSFIPQESDKLSSYINLRTRDGQENIQFNDDSVIITEKLASLLNLKIGDNIYISDGKNKMSLKITAITENYVFNYIYISPKIYEAKTGEKLEFNSIVSKLTDKGKMDEDNLAQYLLKQNDILVVYFNSQAIDSFSGVVEGLNSVVFIMIACAAALAIVVLYNLTNINIAERMREIATIKVLGFTNSESSNYVYRENIILAIIGIVLGLVMGIFLSGYIVSSIEMDIVMFGRQIKAISFIYATAFTFIFTILTNLAMYKKINNISMVESLKSVE